MTWSSHKRRDYGRGMGKKTREKEAEAESMQVSNPWFALCVRYDNNDVDDGGGDGSGLCTTPIRMTESNPLWLPSMPLAALVSMGSVFQPPLPARDVAPLPRPPLALALATP